MASSSSLDASIAETCSLISECTISDKTDDIESEVLNLPKKSKMESLAAEIKDAAIFSKFEDIQKLIETAKAVFRKKFEVLDQEVPGEEKDILKLNFERFRILIIESIEKFVLLQKKIVDVKLPDQNEFIINNLINLINNIQKVIFTLFFCEFENFTDNFPLFRYLSISSNNNQYVIAENVWKLTISYIQKDNDSDEIELSLITFQNLSNHLYLFDKVFNSKQPTDQKEDVKIDEKGFSSYYSSHLINAENWIGCNTNLYRSKMVYFNAWKNKTAATKIHLDIITYTLLMLYDSEQDQFKIGGFDDIEIKVRQRYYVFDMLRYLVMKSNYEQTNADLNEDQIFTALQNKICMLSARVDIRVAESDEKYIKLYNQIRIICNKIIEIEEAEKKAYEIFMQEHPELSQIRENELISE